MNAKEKLKRDFSANPDKYYRVKLFKEVGFERKKCSKCGSYFWTLENDRKVCPNPPCADYSFIGKPPIKGMDYIETWKTIEKFFIKNGHESVPSYPVVCRWFPGLFFTVASIVAFQRSVAGKTVFEMPAEKVIIPQVCLRFPDIENVGVTGRHMTNFIMIGQHSLYEKVNGVQKGYWKDTCIELDYRMLTEALGLKPEEISFMEDVWVGPNAFGYSLEYYAGGLELGNAVFTEFVGTPEKYKQMGYRVIDMGAGLERFTWLSQGTATAYDAVYGPVMKGLKKTVDFNDSIFRDYSAIAGGLDIEDGDPAKIKAKIAKKLGISLEELNKNVEPLQALYAIADHTKTLLYAVNDGGLLSNVGGGYNLRIIFRRALNFIEKYNLNIDLFDVCKKHAEYLKPLNPELLKSLPELEQILELEKDRYRTTLNKGVSVVKEILKKQKKLETGKLIQMYESQGITPELIENVAEKEKLDVEIPKDFYQKLSEGHLKEASKTADDKKAVDVKGLPETKLMFYDNEDEMTFTAKVLKVIKDGKNSWVVLDRTLFYPEGGGQDFDTGTMNGKDVSKVEKFGSVVAHMTDASGFNKGNRVKCEVNRERRRQHAQHHTAVHLINGAARKLLGNHVWQAGAGKSLEKAHLDITHYEALTIDEISKLEELANGIVRKKVPITKKFMPRPKAEKLHGMRIYQGGAIPDNMVRIVNTPNWDVEACAGTHLSNTRDCGRIAITSSERIQDGVVRLSLVAGGAAEKYIKSAKSEASNLYSILNGCEFVRFSGQVPSRDDFMMLSDLRKASQEFSVGMDMLASTAERFMKDLKTGKIYAKPVTFNELFPAMSYVFETWKANRKALDDARKQAAGSMSADLLKRAEDGLLVEILDSDRKEMVKTAAVLLSKDPKLTVVLSNSAGEVVVMSNARDTSQVMEKVTAKCGGKGGGKGHLAQGKIEKVSELKSVNF